MQADIKRITQLADTVSSSIGLSVVDVRLVQQGKRRTMEITIYRPGGRIGLDDCEQMSRQLEAALELEPDDVFESSFDLEVQSPGIDRKLASEREYSLFSGLPVEVKTKQKVEGLGSAFTGKLLGLENDSVMIADPQKLIDNPKPKHKSAKVQAPLEKESLGTIAVQMSNVISVQLLPQPIGALSDQEDDVAELPKTE